MTLRRRWPGLGSVGVDGFIPLGRAAAAMRLSETEILGMVARGELESQTVWGDVLLVRPAVVSRLTVRR